MCCLEDKVHWYATVLGDTELEQSIDRSSGVKHYHLCIIYLLVLNLVYLNLPLSLIMLCHQNCVA